MKRLSRIFFIYAFFLLPSVAGTVSNDNIGFTVTLPDIWVAVKTTDTSMTFIDSSGKYLSAIGIYYENFTGNTLFTTSDEWTRAQFVSYEITTNANSLAALVFTDTVSLKQNGTYWATEAYTYNFETDSMIISEWAEYIRHVAVGKSGYELFVIGSIPDLDSNLAYYLKLIDGFQLRGSAPVIQPIVKRRIPQASPIKFSTGRFNLLGQQYGHKPTISIAPQLIIAQRKAECRFR